MAVKLSFDDRKWLLKCYWKVENVVEVQRSWRVKFGTPLQPTRVTTRILDKSKVNGTAENVLKCRCGIKRVLMHSCGFLHDPQRSHWSNVLVRLLPLGNIKEQGVRHKTTITGGTERSDWTCHQWYCISNNPDDMSICPTSRRWECTVEEGGHFELVRP